MAEKAEKKAEAGHGDAKEGAAKGGIGALLGKLPVLLGIVMVVEAVVLFAGFKFLGGSPKPAAATVAVVGEESHGAEGAAAGHGAEGGGEGGHGAEGAPAGPKDKRKTVEVPVIEFKAPNTLSGRRYIYDVAIVATTKAEYEEKLKSLIKDRDATLRDRIRTIIAQSDPDKLGGGSEPGLETLRRQVKYQLDELAGEGLVDEVLIPRCIPFRGE